MLRKRDSMFGHIILDTENGAIYEDDRTLVDFADPRPCKKCGLKVENGCQDPCIANLPCTAQACCGHGLETESGRRPYGYVALNDGRSIRFSGTQGGENIRSAVNAVLAGDALPTGFEIDAARMWWEGLSEAQRTYVQSHMTRGLAQLVREATSAQDVSEDIIAGKVFWYNGLDEKQKEFVESRIRGMLAELVEEALKNS